MLKKIHFKIELISLYIKKNLFLILLLVIAGIVSYLNQNHIIRWLDSPRFNVEIIGIEGRYTKDNLPDSITGLVSYGLTINTENGRVEMSPLVKEWSLENNNKDYVFTLNEGISWHNKKKFTAYDIDYQINGAKITYVNANQIRISLNSAYSPLLSSLTRPLLKNDLTGVGEYVVKQISYEEGYVKKIKLYPKNKTLPKKTFIFYQSEKDLINAYKLGEINQIEELTSLSDIQDWPHTKIVPKSLANKKYIGLFINTEKFSSKQLRQALNYATPKAKEKNDRSLGPISPLSWAYNSTVKEYNYNPTRAQELIENNSIEKVGISVTDRRLLSLAEEIKSSWSSILDITVDISIENQIDPNNFDFILAYGGIPNDPDQYLFWHSTQGKTNLTKLNNPKIDKLLEEGRQTFDYQERKRIYQDFQRTLLEESPAIFISFPTAYTVTRTK